MFSIKTSIKNKKIITKVSKILNNENLKYKTTEDALFFEAVTGKENIKTEDSTFIEIVARKTINISNDKVHDEKYVEAILMQIKDFLQAAGELDK